MGKERLRRIAQGGPMAGQLANMLLSSWMLSHSSESERVSNAVIAAMRAGGRMQRAFWAACRA